MTSVSTRGGGARTKRSRVEIIRVCRVLLMGLRINSFRSSVMMNALIIISGGGHT